MVAVNNRAFQDGDGWGVEWAVFAANCTLLAVWWALWYSSCCCCCCHLRPSPSASHPPRPPPSPPRQVSDQGAEGDEEHKKFLNYKYPALTKTQGSFTLHVSAQLVVVQPPPLLASLTRPPARSSPPPLLQVEPGSFTDSEIIVMLGENGTGKTTFIRVLAGMLKPGGWLLHGVRARCELLHACCGSVEARPLDPTPRIHPSSLPSLLLPLPCWHIARTKA